MKVLVIGSGGREHAITHAVVRSMHRETVYCSPGNPGTSCLGHNVDLDPSEYVNFAKKEDIGLTIVGPEKFLCNGIVDDFHQAGLRIFGPTKKASQIESSKTFAKNFMEQANIPTAVGKSFSDYDMACKYASEQEGNLVVKASGLARGKGVYVCDGLSEALMALQELMISRRFGNAGNEVVIEERLEGEEISVHVIVSGTDIVVLDLARDYKRLRQYNKGPNTGGMGAYSPVDINDELMQEIFRNIIKPTVDALKEDGIHYQGVIYFGLMLTSEGPKVLEYNCRFGDPESQVILPRLESDFLELINSCIDNRLPEYEIKWSDQCAVCIVVASKGYPETSDKGTPIFGIEKSRPAITRIHHSGTQIGKSGVETNGGRILSITGMGNTIDKARHIAYESLNAFSADRVEFDGMQFRGDIAKKSLDKSNFCGKLNKD